MRQTVCLQIDGITLTGSKGDTILDVAKANDIFIPTLCAKQGLSPAGACRLCVVEVKGVPRLLASCVTAVEEDMEVTTQTARLTKCRRMMLELLLAERNHICAVCVSNGHCELQTLTQQLGVSHTRFVYRYPNLDVDATHERFMHDPNRCILCGRCVRACEEVEGARTWGFTERGVHCELQPDLMQTWGASGTCTGCGKCVQVCPTGAISEKGKSVGEMAKQEEMVPRLMTMRVSDEGPS